MKAHLRGRAAQAGAFLAMVVGGIAVAPAVAFADPPDVQINNPSDQVVSGGRLTMQFRVVPASNDNGPGQGNGGPVRASIRVSTSGGMRCEGQACNQNDAVLDPNNGASFSVQLIAPNVGAGQTQQAQVQVTATVDGESSSDDTTITIKGPDRPQSVSGITGTVKDQDGRPIPGAAVGIQDSAGFQDQTTTNGSGRYSFRSSDNRPIAPGNISVGAGKDGFQAASVQVQGQAGRTVNVPLTLKKIVAATPSATPSVSASATTDPTEEATEDAPTDAATTAAEADTENTASSDGGGASWIYIVIGGLLVAAGVGAMVLVFLRRKNNNNNDGDDDDPTNMSGPGGVVPPSQGRFNDATRVAAPVGGGAAAQTMVAPRAGAPMSDAPTMLQRPVPADDEFPDPYGAPMPPQGGYAGAASGGWDDQAGYDQATQYGGPRNDGYGQYGAAADDAAGQYPGGGQYGAGQQQLYNEPTGMYRPADDDGYADYDRGGYGAGGAYGGSAPAGGQYGGAAADAAGAGRGQYGGGQYGGNGGYADPAGYDQSTQYGGGGQAGGGQAGGAYGGSAAGGGQYGGSAGQYGGGQYGGAGYGDQYDDQAGYDQQAGGGQHGGGAYRDPYDEQQAGYDQRGGYRGQPRQGSSRPGQRRSPEWDEN